MASGGRIFVSDVSLFQGQPSRIIQVNPDTGAATLVTSGDLLVLPTGLAVDAGGMLLVADAASFAEAPFDRVIKIDPTDGSQTLVDVSDAESAGFCA